MTWCQVCWEAETNTHIFRPLLNIFRVKHAFAVHLTYSSVIFSLFALLGQQNLTTDLCSILEDSAWFDSILNRCIPVEKYDNNTYVLKIQISSLFTKGLKRPYERERERERERGGRGLLWLTPHWERYIQDQASFTGNLIPSRFSAKESPGTSQADLSTRKLLSEWLTSWLFGVKKLPHYIFLDAHTFFLLAQFT